MLALLLSLLLPQADGFVRDTVDTVEVAHVGETYYLPGQSGVREQAGIRERHCKIIFRRWNGYHHEIVDYRIRSTHQWQYDPYAVEPCRDGYRLRWVESRGFPDDNGRWVEAPVFREVTATNYVETWHLDCPEEMERSRFPVEWRAKLSK